MEGSQKGNDSRIKVPHLITENPTKVWEEQLFKEIRDKEIVNPATAGLLPNVDKDKKLTFVCLSDTHEKIKQAGQEFQKKMPDGDVLIHCGDFTRKSNTDDIVEFNKFLGPLPHKVKLVVAGNHEMCFQRDFHTENYDFLDNLRKELGLSLNASQEEIVKKCKSLLENASYLEDTLITLCGIDIYGSPWCPEPEKHKFRKPDTSSHILLNLLKECRLLFEENLDVNDSRQRNIGFTLKRGERILAKWEQIPSSTKILITHAPPCGYGDKDEDHSRAGCVELQRTVIDRVKPEFHVFGHIHSNYGMSTNRRGTIFINAALYDSSNQSLRAPIVFEYKIPDGSSKQDLERFVKEFRPQS